MLVLQLTEESQCVKLKVIHIFCPAVVHFIELMDWFHVVLLIIEILFAVIHIIIK